MSSEFKPTIGLEMHVQLDTESKMFCRDKNKPYSSEPNSITCPICLAHPGTLPKINRKAVEMVIKAGLALNCNINRKTRFHRKNYSYPDLPKGYQISQYDRPLCENGLYKDINIRRVHLEEDTGSLIHKEGYSLIDFNRASVPLMELVTEPDMNSAKEVSDFAKSLKNLWQYISISEADMEKGQLRLEANVSISKEDDETLGEKVELKNINSFKNLRDAVRYEIKRQKKILKDGGTVKQATRGWDTEKGKTFSQREKEEAKDYRYFPDPDLVPLNLEKDYIDGLRQELPETPEAKKARFLDQYSLKEEDISLLVKNRSLSNYFEKALSEVKKEKDSIDTDKELDSLTFNYLDKLRAILKEKEEQSFSSGINISPENFADLIFLVASDDLSSNGAEKVLEAMLEKEGLDPKEIMEEKDLKQVSDESELEGIAEEVIEENPEPAEDYRSGKEDAIQALVGKIMQKTKGKANPKLAKEILVSILED